MGFRPLPFAAHGLSVSMAAEALQMRRQLRQDARVRRILTERVGDCRYRFVNMDML